ncbi:MAG: DnaJ domain-containing protein [Thermodesulfobacteriota bacterium]
MSKKNFYKILGINQEADPATIKKAYRRAAKRYHPDISPKDEQKFKEVQEAYETLSDPQKKVLYDQQFPRKATPQPSFFGSQKPARRPFDLFDGIDWLFEWDDLFPFFGEPAEGLSDLSVEITLTPEEAKKGCDLPLKIPMESRCRRCHGTGRVGNLICGLCRGKGEEKIQKQINVELPPGMRNGMKIRIRLGDRNGKGADLIATIRVSGD